MAMVGCALYVRNSTDKQEHSADNQRYVLTEYAKKHKYNIVKTYADEGISGTKAEKRPAFMQMVDDSTKGDFKVVLIYDSSRFARNLQESLVYKSMLKNNNVDLISITEPVLDDETSLLTDALLGAMNEMYSLKLSKNVTRGMVYMSQNGEFPTPPPYGYKKKGGITKIVEDEAKVVRKIFEMYINRPVYHAVTVDLNSMGYRTRKGCPWGSRDIKRTLTNPAYIGLVTYKGNSYTGKHEPIIDKALFDNIQIIINNNSSKRKMRPASTVKHWLSGVLKCGKCTGSLSHVTPKKGLPFFRCHSQAVGKCNVSNFTPVHMIENIVISSLLELLNSSEKDIEYLDYVLKPADENDKCLIEDSIKRVEAKLLRHKEAYANGVDDLDEYKTNKQICESELKEFELKLLQFNNIDKTFRFKVLQTNTKNLLEILKDNELSIEKKNLAVKAVIWKIIIDRKSNLFKVFYYL